MFNSASRIFKVLFILLLVGSCCIHAPQNTRNSKYKTVYVFINNRSCLPCFLEIGEVLNTQERLKKGLKLFAVVDTSLGSAFIHSGTYYAKSWMKADSIAYLNFKEQVNVAWSWVHLVNISTPYVVIQGQDKIMELKEWDKREFRNILRNLWF